MLTSATLTPHRPAFVVIVLTVAIAVYGKWAGLSGRQMEIAWAVVWLTIGGYIVLFTKWR